MQEDFTQEFTRLFSNPEILKAASSLNIPLDDRLTVPTAALHAAIEPSTPYSEFVKKLAAVPILLLSKDRERVASAAFSLVNFFMVSGKPESEILSILDKALLSKDVVAIQSLSEKSLLIWIKGNRDAFAKAVAEIKEKAKPDWMYYLNDPDKDLKEEQNEEIKGEVKEDIKGSLKKGLRNNHDKDDDEHDDDDYIWADPEPSPIKLKKMEPPAPPPKPPKKLYSVKELLKIYSEMDPKKMFAPRTPKNLDWYEKDAVNVVLRRDPIHTLAVYLPAVHQEREYFGYRNHNYYNGYNRNYVQGGRYRYAYNNNGYRRRQFV